MNTGLLGALLVLAGTSLGCLRWIGGRRRELRALRQLAAALERMEGAVRWENLSMDRLLAREAEEDAGALFGAVKEHMEQGRSLQEAWQTVFAAVRPPEAARILCLVQLWGDTQQITGSLHLAAGQLCRLAGEKAAQQGQKERLCVALGASLGCLLVIVLI